MAILASRRPQVRTVVLPAAAAYRRDAPHLDGGRLPPARRLRAGAREIPSQSRIIFRDGIVAMR